MGLFMHKDFYQVMEVVREHETPEKARTIYSELSTMMFTGYDLEEIIDFLKKQLGIQTLDALNKKCYYTFPIN